MWGWHTGTLTSGRYSILRSSLASHFEKSHLSSGADLTNALHIWDTTMDPHPFNVECLPHTFWKLWSGNTPNSSNADRIWCIYAFLSSCLDESSISGCPGPWSSSRIFLLYFDFLLDFPILMSGAVYAAILKPHLNNSLLLFTVQRNNYHKCILWFIFWIDVNLLDFQ